MIGIQYQQMRVKFGFYGIHVNFGLHYLFRVNIFSIWCQEGGKNLGARSETKVGEESPLLWIKTKFVCQALKDLSGFYHHNLPNP